MNSFYKSDEYFDYTASQAVSSGDIVVQGDLIGVAVADIAAGATGAIRRNGVVKVTKEAGTAWVQGTTRVYYDSAADDFNTTSTGTYAGRAALAAASAATTGYVMLGGPDDVQAKAANVAALTDNSGGVATGSVIATISDSATANAIADIVAHQTSMLTALKSAGIMTADS